MYRLEINICILYQEYFFSIMPILVMVTNKTDAVQFQRFENTGEFDNCQGTRQFIRNFSFMVTYPANILYRPDIGFYIGPTSAADIGPMLDVQFGYTSGRYRLPTCSRYCADIHRSSLFLAKTPFFIVKTQCK